MKLTDSIQYLKGIGPKSAENFQKLGIETVEDLLTYFPFRYEDFASRRVSDLMDGEKAVIIGLVVTPATVSYFGARRNRLTFKIKQEGAVIGVTYFNQPYLASKVETGKMLAVYGKWDLKKQTLLGLKILAEFGEETEEGQEFEPVYHLVSGVKQSQLVTAIKNAFDLGMVNQMVENLPSYLLKKYQLMGRQAAVGNMHFPVDMMAHKQAIRRIKFEELFFFQLRLQALRYKEKTRHSGEALKFKRAEVEDKIDQLPFELTQAQVRTLDEILTDMEGTGHMNRLLQGDVGSGKTIVASLAMYAAALANFQSAIMVPTEILARQHYRNLSHLFPELHIGLLVNGLNTSDRRQVLTDLANGHLHMVVGTHALIQEGVDFYRLGLVITDEQHRFGVNQRKLLREKGQNPDVLMMTATPIPRTLAITTFGDMDVSVIDELPAGRLPIRTRWIKHQQLIQVLEWLRLELLKGAQAYFVSPLIEESELLDLKNAEALYGELKDFFSHQVKIDLLHGRMRADEKDTIMQSFKHGESRILVSTTVIEVGVDVPNARVMVIMDADRFGLSQLHQLRGRVGRGKEKSYCILVANPKTESGRHRMESMVQTQNGFELAEEDLRMRGSGEIFGVRQSGLPEFAVADVVMDAKILEAARQEAVAVFEQPDLPEHAWLIRKIDHKDELN